MKLNICILLCTVFLLWGNIGFTLLHISADYLFYVLFAYSLFIISFYKYGQEWSKIEWLSLWIVGSALVWLAFRYAIGEQGAFRQTVFILILPAFLISTLPHKFGLDNIRLRTIISRFLYCFFFIECGLAIVEFVFQQHIFGWVEMTYAKGIVKYALGEFRSAAILGSPLSNALFVTILMVFYLFSPRLPMKQKIPLWFLGLIAVFCFNARAAIAVNLLSLVAFVCKEFFILNTEKRYQYILFLSVTTCIVLFLLYSHNFGNRFWETDSFSKDGSIRIRLRLFKYLLKVDWSDYLWGYSSSKINHIMETVIGVKVIENFWILYIFRLGFPLTIYFTVLYSRLCANLLASYPLFDKVVISSSFLILASSNNSLYVNFIPLFTFILCAYTYSPILISTKPIS